ncbi:Do family serine endopeptidase [Neorhizobium lilium]|uniref:Probable periplasmic serine endoprotease DegP-like n=1 Tax=Neorhizobium lilium TaxID=2503024 RepID=A0A444LHD7_9HYPH|nr:Do family serine endopeptidase [Neorhizobium lilium]RWX78443.1 Do family serine endopeptidase [Neorhizobium lilium]
MAHSTLSSWKRSVAVGTALALLGVPLHALAQVPAAPTAPSPAPEAIAPGGMLPAPPPTAPTINPPSKAAAVPAGPSSVSDLAEGLLDAVVNISTSQSVKDEGAGPQPQIQQGSPFEEFFDDFFDDKSNDGKNKKVSSLGSGFVIDPAGFVVTNNHVIEGADDIEVIFPNGTKLKAKLVGTDTKTDLSVLKVESKTPLKAVPFGNSRNMRIGDWVMAIGNPFGLGGSVTLGIISARGRNINAGPYDNFIQTDAAINKGNSGGPLFNMRGEVIGINTAIISPSGGSIGIGFAVPTEIAENVVHQLIEFGETRRGWLGVRIQPVTDDVAASLGLDRTRGALVSGVVDDGPIKSGEMKAGDVILSFDGQPINEMRDLPRIVAESPVGKQVDVVLMRDGKQQTVKVTLGKLEDTADATTDDDKPAAPEGEGKAPDGKGGPGGAQGQTADAPVALFGMTLATLGDEQRKSFGIAESVEGVVITKVDEGSVAAEKGLKPGEVIVEVAQDFVENPGEVTEKMEALKTEGRRNAHVMIADKSGNLRFVALPLE